MTEGDDELRLHRPYRLVFPDIEGDRGRAVLVPALADQAELPLTSLPGAGVRSEALVQGAKTYFILRNLPHSGVHVSTLRR